MKPKNPERKKILKLQVDNEIRFSLIGISSHENDYRLVWAVNNHLGFSFSRIDDLVVHQAKTGTDLEFSRYIYTAEESGITYSLISNRCDNGFLFADIRNLDFLIKMNGEVTNQEILDLVKKLKACEVISACYKLDPLKIKGIPGILQE